LQDVPTAALLDITNNNTVVWFREKLRNITSRFSQGDDVTEDGAGYP
jgi:hypothetical protein